MFIKIGDADINDRPKIAFQEKPCSEEYGFFLDNLPCLCYNTNKCSYFQEGKMGKDSCGTGDEKVKKGKKHNKHTLGEDGDMTVHKNKFGFVEIENPVYYNNNYYHAPPQFLMRKATPEERREMVVNYIIRRNGKPISIDNLANKLAVSKRTIQLLMKSLKDEGLIDVQPTFDKCGKQRHNSYRYIGPPVEKFGSGLTIGMLYDVKNRAGFRDWDWEEYSYKNKGYFDLQDLYISKSHRRKTRGRYLEHFKKDESACIRKPKYLAIRYRHYISQKDGKETPVEYIRINYKTGEVYDSRPGELSSDGTKKFKIDFAEREIAFTLFGIPFGGVLEGSEDNPKITIFNLRTKETYAQFTYWGENYLYFVWDAEDDDREENLIVHGEFASK